MCIHAYVHVCMYACMHLCMYANRHTDISTYLHACKHACRQAGRQENQTDRDRHIQIHIHNYTYMNGNQGFYHWTVNINLFAWIFASQTTNWCRISSTVEKHMISSKTIPVIYTYTLSVHHITNIYVYMYIRIMYIHIYR